ncbi:MAG: ROK family protein, partial [Clostridia bacterium]|nr:ROK family protein [Clostridia bacterium]
MPFYIGIDVGGTNIKGIVIDKEGKLLCKASVPSGTGKEIAENAAVLCNRLISESGQPLKNFKGVGVGCAGMIDSANGTVIFAGNLNLEKFPLAEKIEEKVGLKVYITNDANAAALGEAKFGAGKNYKNSVLVTLGTGVGGGIVIDGKLFEGNRSTGAEIGHMVIERGGDRCTCGRHGCFEAYSSATALIKRTKWAMEEDAGSLMWQSCTSDTADGKTAFSYADTDVSAKEVVEWYIKRLACGLVNLANIFRPEIIMLGGGVAGQGERLTVPLQNLLDKELFGGTQYAPVKIAIASLGSDAGAFG